MPRFSSASHRKHQLSPSQKRANSLAREERDFLAQLVGLRKKSGLTQSGVAEILGVSQQAISKSSPTLATIITYAHAIDAVVQLEAFESH